MSTQSRFDLPAELDIPDDEDLSKDRLDQAFAYLLGQIKVMQGFAPEYNAQIEILRTVGLSRLNEALLPVYTQLVGLTQLGALFTAPATGTNATTAGLATFQIDPARAGNFAASDYLTVRDTQDPNYRLFGALQSYDRASGTLAILVDQVVGTPANPTGSAWVISAAASPSPATTAHAVGAYTQAEVDALVSGLGPAIALKAPLASPALTGTPTVPTPAQGDNSTRIASTAFVQTVSTLLATILTGGAPATLNTLGKLATAIGSDPAYATTIQNALNARLRLDDIQSLTDGQKSQGRSNLGAQATLGYTPVQQGGGAGQGSNTVKLGWSGSRLKAQVDTTDLGNLWAGLEPTFSAASNGYQILPSGLILQWGKAVNASISDFGVLFNISFPNEVYQVVASIYGDPGATNLYSVQVDGGGLGNFIARVRRINSSTQITGATNIPVSWWAIGR